MKFIELKVTNFFLNYFDQEQWWILKKKFMRLILDYELIVNMKEIRSIFFDRYAKLFYLNQIIQNNNS